MLFCKLYYDQRLKLQTKYTVITINAPTLLKLFKVLFIIKIKSFNYHLFRL